MEYRYGSHAFFNIEHHFSWVIKYHVLQDDIDQRVRELVRQTCEALEIMFILSIILNLRKMIF